MTEAADAFHSACGPQLPSSSLCPAAGGGSLECRGCVCVGFGSAPLSLNQLQCTQVTQSLSQAVGWGVATCDTQHGQGEAGLSLVGEGPSRAFRSSAGKGRAQFHCWRAEPGPQVPDQSPLPAQEAPQGGVPSCCSPGRVPCRRRAASPHGWPCPPSWGQRAGGTAGTEGMAPAGMAGGTPRRTCRGQGAGGMGSSTHGAATLCCQLCISGNTHF